MRRAACLLLGLLGPAVAASCGGGAEIDPTGSGGATETAITGAGGGGNGGITTLSGTTTPTSTSTGGSGGSGGSAPVCPPTPPVQGPPLSAPAGLWTWVPFTEAKCRDGSPAGIGVRMSPGSKKLFIYLEGGGACFNAATCAISLGSFGKIAFDGWAGTVGQTGIFDEENLLNPVRDWNAIYVPYCSGDVHAGAATGVDVPGGPQNQAFVGYSNIGHFLSRIVPTFPDAEDVLLTGISAGGFGAAFNYDRVAAAFCPTPVALVDDSGPPMSDTYLAPCLQKQWRELWNLKNTLPAECPACTGPDGGGIVNYVSYLGNKWPQSRLGLISSTHDSVISTFYGFGTANCTQALPIPGDQYAAGLEELRASYLGTSGLWGTYFVASTTHTYLLGPGFYFTQVDGVPLTQWIRDLLNGAASNVGP